MNPSKTRNLFILIVLVVSLAGVIVFGLYHQQSNRAQASVVKTFPTFSAPSLLKPETIETNDVFQSPYQLVNVWASWCGVCKREHDYLLALQQQGVPIIGLNYRDSRGAASQYLAEQGNPYQTVIFDPKGQVALDLGVIGTPETYLVNDKGEIVLKFSGVLESSVWKSSFAHYFLDRS